MKKTSTKVPNEMKTRESTTMYTCSHQYDSFPPSHQLLSNLPPLLFPGFLGSSLATELHGSSLTPFSSILANIPPSRTCTCCRVLEKARTLCVILSVCETGVRFGEKEGNTLIIDRRGTSVDSIYRHWALYLTKCHS